MARSATSNPVLGPKRRGHVAPRLEDTTDAERRQASTAEVTQIRVGNAATVWQITVQDTEDLTVGASLFTVPVSVESGQAAVERAFSVLAAINMSPQQGWRETRNGHYQGPITRSVA